MFLYKCVCTFPQRKVPDQDVAQGSYVALPLTLLLLLAAYNYEKVQNTLHLIKTDYSTKLLFDLSISKCEE